MTMQFQKWPTKFGFDWPFCPSSNFSLYCTLLGWAFLLAITKIANYKAWQLFSSGVLLRKQLQYCLASKFACMSKCDAVPYILFLFHKFDQTCKMCSVCKSTFITKRHNEMINVGSFWDSNLCSNQQEDDLKWVEENLPSSAVDT